MSSEKIVHLVHWWGEGWGGSSRYICLNLFYISPNICWRSGKNVSSEKKGGKKENFHFEIISHNRIYILYIFRQLYHKRNKEREGKTLFRKRKYLCKSLSTFSVWRFRDHFVKVWASQPANDGRKESSRRSKNMNVCKNVNKHNLNILIFQ